jgi:hypothetical protein
LAPTVFAVIASMRPIGVPRCLDIGESVGRQHAQPRVVIG